MLHSLHPLLFDFYIKKPTILFKNHKNILETSYFSLFRLFQAKWVLHIVSKLTLALLHQIVSKIFISKTSTFASFKKIILEFLEKSGHISRPTCFFPNTTLTFIIVTNHMLFFAWNCWIRSF